MSDIIQLLPDSVANQIAAGEVIQRPASVIKELVENAVDAGAKTIHVLVVDAGRTSIQVIDDGKGMSETDARLSFERHATSKIAQADDLFSLRTMGFRGEALASIAAVAQVHLTTRQEGTDLGTDLNISGSRFVSQEPCSCPVGSNFRVENLFYNVPARRKFLKSNATELNNIIAAFERIVLVYPDITFTLHSNESELFNLRASGLRQRIIDVFGKRLNQDLLPLDVDTTICHVTGFVGKPESARKKMNCQYFFVNGRYMKHPYFHRAVQNAFERLVPNGEQVPYFIYFTVPPEDIDVNIHPVKTEIKFENEQAIFQILAAVVKEAVGLYNEVPAIDFDQQGHPDIPTFDPERRNAPMPKIGGNPQYNPFRDSSPRQHRKDTVPDNWQDLYDGLSTEKRPASPPPSQDDLFLPATESLAPDAAAAQSLFSGHPDEALAEKSPVHYQYKGTYIMTAVKSGLMIIDQHRAHIRILYENYLKQMEGHTSASQKVLFPEVVHISVADELTLRKILPEMQTIGFDLADLGGGDYAINGVPAGLDGMNYVSLVESLITATIEQGRFSTDDINHSLALNLARNAAIPQGQVMNNDEMEALINNLFACKNVNYTPDGHSILTILKQQDIDRLF